MTTPALRSVFILLAVMQLFCFHIAAQDSNNISHTGTYNNSSRSTGLEAMYRLHELPLLYPSGTQTRQFSSHDPSGSNNDGNFTMSYTKYIDSNREYVIFDASGPGCLYRQQYNIWYLKQQVDAGKTHIKYYFDNEPVASIDVAINDFFSGKIKPFVTPYAFLDSMYRFGILYYPFSFSKRLKITTTYNLNTLSQSDAPYDAAWYQYTYHTYPANRALKSFPDRDTATEQKVIQQWQHTGDDPKANSRNITVTKKMEIPPGQHFTLAQIEGAGAISGIRIRLHPYNRDVFYKTHLRIYWDTAKKAAVDLPLANFFGAGGETYKNCQDIYKRQLKTLLFGYDGTTGEGYAYWPMPFWKSATFEIWNDSQTKIDSVELIVQYAPGASHYYRQEETGYFYAQRTITQDRGDGIFSNVFKETGRGHVVGLSFYSNNYAMDGDEFTYIDGSRTPQIHGDGTEDDHNQGWGGDAYQMPLWGGVVNGYQGAYRLYLNDAYIFNKDITINYEYSREGGEDYGGEVDAVVYYYKSPFPGNLILTDVLNTGNTQSENAHHYRVSGKTWKRKVFTGYDGYERDYEYDMARDTGYGYNGFSEFVAKILPDNEGVKIRRRIYRSANGIQRSNVYVDGVKVKERIWDICTQTAAPFYQGWYDADFEIPATYTKGKKSVHIKVEYIQAEGSVKEINEFYYWIYAYSKQGASITPQTTIQKVSAAPVKLPPVTGISTASLLQTDTVTKGSWAGKYGKEGFILLQYFFGRNCQALPEYVSSVTYGNMKGIQFSSWYSSTVSSLNASPINPTKRYLGAYTTPGVDSITLYVNDQQQHQLAIYCCDFDQKNRNQQIVLYDLKGNPLCPAMDMQDFGKGKWLIYRFSGNVSIRLTNKQKEGTAVISGLLFDPQ